MITEEHRSLTTLIITESLHTAFRDLRHRVCTDETAKGVCYAINVSVSDAVASNRTAFIEQLTMNVEGALKMHVANLSEVGPFEMIKPHVTKSAFRSYVDSVPEPFSFDILHHTEIRIIQVAFQIYIRKWTE